MGCGLLAKHAIDFAPNKLWGLLLVVGSCELGNELSGYMKGNYFASLASRSFSGRSLPHEVALNGGLGGILLIACEEFSR
jgi:hypothetical protein